MMTSNNLRLRGYKFRVAPKDYIAVIADVLHNFQTFEKHELGPALEWLECTFRGFQTKDSC